MYWITKKSWLALTRFTRALQALLPRSASAFASTKIRGGKTRYGIEPAALLIHVATACGSLWMWSLVGSTCPGDGLSTSLAGWRACLGYLTLLCLCKWSSVFHVITPVICIRRCSNNQSDKCLVWGYPFIFIFPIWHCNHTLFYYFIFLLFLYNHVIIREGKSLFSYDLLAIFCIRN